MSLRTSLLLLLLFTSARASSGAPCATPAAPRIAPVVETVHGVEIRDPYRWMEQGGPEFDTWSRAEAKYARSILDSIPGRQEIYQRISSLSQGSGGVRKLQVRKAHWLYERAVPGRDGPALFMRKNRDGEEQRIDLLGSLPASEGPWSEVHAARVLSPDGRYLTFGTTQNGEANPTLRVYDLELDRLLPDRIVWPLWADSAGFEPRWLADSSGFFYVRRADASSTMDDTERARRGQVFVHRLGRDANTDRAIFGYGITPEIAETDTLYVRSEPHPRWLTLWRRMPDARELWVVDLDELGAEGNPRARRIWASDVSVPGYGVLENWLYIADSNGSPRFRVVRFDLEKNAPTAELALPEQPGVLTHLVAANDAVYVVETLLSKARLHILERDRVRHLDLEDGVVSSLNAGAEGSGVWLTQVDWLVPEKGRLLDAGGDTLHDTGFAAADTVAFDAYASDIGWADARDGERIPYNIVHRKDATLDGSAYVMLEGYGCFGSSYPPFYWPALAAWLEHGGVFVRAAMRGGGELGADWHRAGQDRNKPIAFEDAIDVARHLIRANVTRPGRIGVTGGSCGGLTMGMAALEAPHLIGAAVLSVGAFDPWRLASNSSAGARSIRDIGDPATAEGTRRILAMSPYMQVLDGAPRPAMLIANGATDYAIPLWVAGKMVARTRAALPDGKPVLWDIQWDAGHNVGVDYTQVDTDTMAFLFWQLGHPDFQPTSTQPPD